MFEARWSTVNAVICLYITEHRTLRVKDKASCIKFNNFNGTKIEYAYQWGADTKAFTRGEFMSALPFIFQKCMGNSHLLWHIIILHWKKKSKITEYQTVCWPMFANLIPGIKVTEELRSFFYQPLRLCVASKDFLSTEAACGLGDFDYLHCITSI